MSRGKSEILQICELVSGICLGSFFKKKDFEAEFSVVTQLPSSPALLILPRVLGEPSQLSSRKLPLLDGLQVVALTPRETTVLFILPKMHCEGVYQIWVWGSSWHVYQESAVFTMRPVGSMGTRGSFQGSLTLTPFWKRLEGGVWSALPVPHSPVPPPAGTQWECCGHRLKE